MDKLYYSGSVKEELKSSSLFNNKAKIGDKTAWVMVEEENGDWRISWVLEYEESLVYEKYRIEQIEDSHLTRLWKK